MAEGGGGMVLGSWGEILLVREMEGNHLTRDRGAPLSLVAPYDLGYKNIKFVIRIEFSTEEKAGWRTLAKPDYPVNDSVPAGRLRKKKE